MENCIKLRINAGEKSTSNAQDKATADAYGNKFIILLDFEMLDSAAPYYQAGLGNRLCYKLTFNDYNQVTKSGVSSPKVPDAKYKITDISLEYEIVTQPNLARSIRSEYQHMALLYDRILRHRKIIVKGQLQRFHKLISNDRIWPSEHGFEVIFEKSLFVFEISAFKVRNKRGILSWFHSFSENNNRETFVFDVTSDQSSMISTERSDLRDCKASGNCYV